jgi:uncharacterized protein
VEKSTAIERQLTITVESIEEPRQPFVQALPRAFLAEALAGVPAYEVTGPAELSAHLTRLSGRDVLLEARLRLALESDCRRCLRPVASAVPVDFMLNMVAAPLDASGKTKKGDKDRGGRGRGDDEGDDERSASFDDAEADVEPFDGERVELAPIIREQLVLALPSIEPVCSEACKGLCATCGQDLNEADCGHSARGLDPRWAALKGLKV